MIETNVIHCGDALTVMRDMPDRCIDMIFCDPPFGHNNNNGDLIHRVEEAIPSRRRKGDDGTDVYEARAIATDGVEANQLFQDFLLEAKRLLKNDGCCCCCCCGCGGGPDPQFARWSLWMDAVLTFKHMVIWDKGPIGMGWHFRRSSETVLVAHKGRKCNWYADSREIENVIRPGDYGIRKIIPSADQHPTEKPWQLAGHFLALMSKPGDLILDPFCGSGSTLEAAKRVGCEYVGIDIDQRWIDMATDRMARCHPTADPFDVRLALMTKNKRQEVLDFA